MNNSPVSSSVSEEPRRGDAAPTTDAGKPFDSSAKADIILRSSDSVDFFVLKSILSIASPIFDDMFSLDRGDAKEKNLTVTKNGLPVIELGEGSTALYGLLQLAYPYDAPLDGDIKTYVKVGEAARKYGMDYAMQKLAKSVGSCKVIVKQPLRVFAVATHFGWVDVMKEAALNTLSIPMRDLGRCEELQLLSGTEHYDLLHWRFSCLDVLDKLFVSWESRGATNWSRMSRKLRQRLKETGCPRSEVLMNDDIIAEALEHTSESDCRQIMSFSKSMARHIEQTLSSQVPLVVGNIWVVPPPAPPPTHAPSSPLAELVGLE